MTTVLVQHAHGAALEMLELARPVHETAAAARGWGYLTDNQRLCPDRLVHWEKWRLLRDLLRLGPDGQRWIFLDADALLVDAQALWPAEPFAACVYYLGRSDEPQAQAEVNSGVMVLVNSPEVRQFVEDVWVMGGTYRPHIGDEPALNRVLQEKGFKKAILEPRFNCWENNRHLVAAPVVRAWHGDDLKVEKLRAAVKER